MEVKMMKKMINVFFFMIFFGTMYLECQPKYFDIEKFLVKETPISLKSDSLLTFEGQLGVEKLFLKVDTANYDNTSRILILKGAITGIGNDSAKGSFVTIGKIRKNQYGKYLASPRQKILCNDGSFSIKTIINKDDYLIFSCIGSFSREYWIGKLVKAVK